MRTTLIILTLLVMSSCKTRYTETQARKLFGCIDTVSSKTETKPPVLTKVDSGETKVQVKPADSATVYNPCDSLLGVIKRLEAGKSITIPSNANNGASLKYGKDKQGTIYIQANCDPCEAKVKWYKEKWLQTAQTTTVVRQPEITAWEWIKSYWMWVLLALVVGVIIGVLVRR